MPSYDVRQSNFKIQKRSLLNLFRSNHMQLVMLRDLPNVGVFLNAGIAGMSNVGNLDIMLTKELATVYTGANPNSQYPS